MMGTYKSFFLYQLFKIPRLHTALQFSYLYTWDEDEVTQTFTPKELESFVVLNIFFL